MNRRENQNFTTTKIGNSLNNKLKQLLICIGLALWVTLTSTSAMATQYSPNFKGTNITEFINIVGKNLKKTFIVDPNVRGKVNVRSYDLLTEKQYYQFFLNVLEVYGYAAVNMDNNIVKIIRNKDAKKSSIPVVDSQNPGRGDEMVTRVVEVKNVTVRELSPLLRQLLNQAGSGNVVNYDPANVIMLTGTAAVVNRLVKIIQRVDKAGDHGVDIVPLKYATASEMVRIVETMNKSSNGKLGRPTFLIPKIVADERTNSLIVSGEHKTRQRVISLIKRLDKQLKNNGNTRVFYLKYAKAKDLVKVLQGVSKSITTGKTKNNNSRRKNNNNSASIEADEATNALVITGQPDMLRSLATVIRQLDVRRAQVEIQAIIVEIFENNGASLGVQWYNKNGGFSQFNNGPAPIGKIAAGALAARSIPGTPGSTVTDVNGNVTVNPNGNSTRGDYSLIAEALGSANGIMFGIMHNNWGAIVQAISTDTNSNILATPSITTLDNVEASFLVGSEVPVITGSATGNNNSNPFQTIKRKKVGIKLKVTPQINDGSAIQLKIEQEVSSVSGATGVDISINTRELKTTVMADDGATIVLGGLIDEDVQESKQKVPLLGDLPLIGALFRSTKNTKRKRNLMVFLRATILRDGKSMNELSRKKYNFIRKDEQRRKNVGLSLMNANKIPLLPEWNDKLVLPPSYANYKKTLLKKKISQPKLVKPNTAKHDKKQ